MTPKQAIGGFLIMWILMLVLTAQNGKATEDPWIWIGCSTFISSMIMLGFYLIL